MTVIQLADKLRTEADAYRYLEKLRWGDGQPVCPHCDTRLFCWSLSAPVQNCAVVPLEKCAV
jgi:hypothetical protein